MKKHSCDTPLLVENMVPLLVDVEIVFCTWHVSELLLQGFRKYSGLSLAENSYKTIRFYQNKHMRRKIQN